MASPRPLAALIAFCLCAATPLPGMARGGALPVGPPAELPGPLLGALVEAPAPQRPAAERLAAQLDAALEERGLAQVRTRGQLPGTLFATLPPSTLLQRPPAALAALLDGLLVLMVEPYEQQGFQVRWLFAGLGGGPASELGSWSSGGADLGLRDLPQRLPELLGALETALQQSLATPPPRRAPLSLHALCPSGASAELYAPERANGPGDPAPLVYRGPTPLSLPLAPGSYALTLRCAGCETMRQTLAHQAASSLSFQSCAGQRAPLPVAAPARPWEMLEGFSVSFGTGYSHHAGHSFLMAIAFSGPTLERGPLYWTTGRFSFSPQMQAEDRVTLIPALGTLAGLRATWGRDDELRFGLGPAVGLLILEDTPTRAGYLDVVPAAFGEIVYVHRIRMKPSDVTLQFGLDGLFAQGWTVEAPLAGVLFAVRFAPML